MQAYVNSLNANPAWTANIANLEHDVPASIAVQVKSDPQSFVELLATETTTPAYLSAVPTGVVQTLTSLASAPLHAVADIEIYVKSLYHDKHNKAAFSVLATDVPRSVQEAAIADPIGFLATLVAASTYPSWVSAIPESLQSPVASAIDSALRIVSSDVHNPLSPRAHIPFNVTSAAATTTLFSGPSSLSVSATPGSGITTAPSATGSPIVFSGGVGSLRPESLSFAWMIGVVLATLIAL